MCHFDIWEEASSWTNQMHVLCLPDCTEQGQTILAQLAYVGKETKMLLKFCKINKE